MKLNREEPYTKLLTGTNSATSEAGQGLCTCSRHSGKNNYHVEKRSVEKGQWTRHEERSLTVKNQMMVPKNSQRARLFSRMCNKF